MRPYYLFFLALCTLTIVGCKQAGTSITETPSQYYTDSIYSEELGEYRLHDIYLPKGFDPQKQYPIVYATDGQMLETDDYYKQALDSLIDNEMIEPFIMVGSHSNGNNVPGTEMQTEDGQTFAMQYRFFEYVRTDHGKDVHPSLENIYQRHMNYFINELIPSIEGELGQNPSPSQRYFYGVSNGAAFGANLLTNHPSLIDTYIMYSTLGASITEEAWEEGRSYPQLYLQYGDKEGDAFRDEAEYIRNKYLELGQSCELNVYEGEHLETIWRVLFAQRAARLFTTEG